MYLKWNFLRISLWKWKKWILFIKIIIKHSFDWKYLVLFFFFGECIYITYQIKKCVYMCVYIIKKCVCIYICVKVVLINILVSQLGPKQKFMTPICFLVFVFFFFLIEMGEEFFFLNVIWCGSPWVGWRGREIIFYSNRWPRQLIIRNNIDPG